jgi:hypothetical protein
MKTLTADLHNMLGSVAPRNRTEQKINEPSGRAEQQRADQARYYKAMTYAELSSIANLPASYEKIKSEVMNPSSQKKSRVTEELADRT